jgi:hypothetical protein
MKSKLLLAAMMTLALSVSVPGFSNDIAVSPKPTTEGTPSPEVQQMLNRLEEIKAIDVKSLPRSERRALRKEVKEIDQKLQDTGYIYISVGALVLIVLLLILLL